LIPHSKPYLSGVDKRQMKKQLLSGMLTEGAAVKEFEKQIGSYTNIKYCISSSCGTSALTMALRALEVKKNDEIILPSYVCKSVADSIIELDAIPVFCDVSEEWIMTYETVKSCITSKTKVIILVHIFGINAWDNNLKKLGIPIIEDNCQALGYEKNGQEVKSKADISIFSFNATKCIATGEGGMMATNKRSYYERALKEKLENYASHKITDLQAALGLSQLSQYQVMKAKRKIIAKKYLNSLPEEILKNTRKIENQSIFYRFPINVKKNSLDSYRTFMEKNGVAIRKGVDAVLHRNYGVRDSDFPQTLQCFETTASIPLYPALKMKEVERIISLTNQYFNNERER
jgi:perosamine synthetase